MRDFMYQEIRKCNKEIRLLSAEEQIKGNKMLLDTLLCVRSKMQFARKQGLLELQMELEDIHELPNGALLYEMLLDISDGVWIEDEDALNFGRYFADGLSGYEGLQFIIMHEGAQGLREGTWEKKVCRRLLSYVPIEITEEFETAVEAEDEAFFKEMQRQAEEERLAKEEHIKGQILPIDSNHPFYSVISEVDKIINDMDDRGIQELLRQTSNETLEKAMLGLSANAKKKISKNLSTRLDSLIQEEILKMGPQTDETVGLANLYMLNVVRSSS